MTDLINELRHWWFRTKTRLYDYLGLLGERET